MIPQETWRAIHYLQVQVHIRLYSSRLKVYRALDPKACSKMLSKSMFEEGQKSQTPSYLQPSDLYSNALIQEFARQLGHWALRNPEECKNIWCWMSSCRLLNSETCSGFQTSLKNSHYPSHQSVGDNSLVIMHELAFNLDQVCKCMSTH